MGFYWAIKAAALLEPGMAIVIKGIKKIANDIELFINVKQREPTVYNALSQSFRAYSRDSPTMDRGQWISASDECGNQYHFESIFSGFIDAQ